MNDETRARIVMAVQKAFDAWIESEGEYDINRSDADELGKMVAQELEDLDETALRGPVRERVDRIERWMVAQHLQRNLPARSEAVPVLAEFDEFAQAMWMRGELKRR